MNSSGSTPFLHYWVAARPMPGQGESGDQYLVADFADGVLIAVVDGLGHGDEAALAARLAVATMESHAHEPVASLMQRCHAALRRTRGAVMSLASYSAATGTLTWLGVGNVEGMLIRGSAPAGEKPQSLFIRGGIVGDRLPALAPATVPVHRGDLLLFATDGIGSMFVRDLRYAEQPCALVNHIFTHYAKTTDDALILGAQWTDGNLASDNRG